MCRDDERAVYKEFPQYEGRTVEAEANEQFGGCFAEYYERPPGDSVQVEFLLRVQSYYGEKLRERGWTITKETSPSDRAFAEPKGVRATGEVPKGEIGDLICARRGEYYYHLLYSVADKPRADIRFQTVVDDHPLPCGNRR